MSISDKLQTIAENEQRVYDAGKTEGIEVGKKSQYDRFWDSYMRKSSYGSVNSQGPFLFAGPGWNDETFKPKYDLKNMTRADGMFHTNQIVDLKGILERQGVILDTSKCTNMSGFACYSRIKYIGVLDISSSTNNNNMLENCPVITIDLLRVSNSGNQAFINTFNNCSNLANITFEGVIGNNISFSSSPLTIESCRSVISCLKDFSGTTTTRTLTLKSTTASLLNAEDRENITSKGWTLVG